MRNCRVRNWGAPDALVPPDCVAKSDSIAQIPRFTCSVNKLCPESRLISSVLASLRRSRLRSTLLLRHSAKVHLADFRCRYDHACISAHEAAIGATVSLLAMDSAGGGGTTGRGDGVWRVQCSY